MICCVRAPLNTSSPPAETASNKLFTAAARRCMRNEVRKTARWCLGNTTLVHARLGGGGGGGGAAAAAAAAAGAAAAAAAAAAAWLLLLLLLLLSLCQPSTE